MRVSVCAAALAVSAGMAASASAQNVRLSLADAVSRALEQSASVVVARARVEEAQGRLIGARLRFRDNPQLGVSAGPRRSGGATTSDIEVSASHTFETGGQRLLRVAGAEANVASAAATVSDERRQAIEAVARAFLTHERAQERSALLTDAESTAAEILRIAQRRYDAGDIAALDLNLARASASRARAATIAADADLAVSNGVLVRLLGFEPSTNIAVDHALEQDRTADLRQLLMALRSRPDLLSLQAAVSEAEAEAKLGASMRRPDLGVDVTAKKEGADRIVVAGLTIAVPWFNRGQELTATGTARAARLRLERDTTERAASAEITSLYTEYVRRRLAAAAFEDALPAATDNEQLSQRSFEEGELSLPDLVVVRREVIETRLEYLDLLFEAAETAVARDAAAGVMK